MLTSGFPFTGINEAVCGIHQTKKYASIPRRRGRGREREGGGGEREGGKAAAGGRVDNRAEAEGFYSDKQKDRGVAKRSPTAYCILSGQKASSATRENPK